MLTAEIKKQNSNRLNSRYDIVSGNILTSKISRVVDPSADARGSAISNLKIEETINTLRLIFKSVVEYLRIYLFNLTNSATKFRNSYKRIKLILFCPNGYNQKSTFHAFWKYNLLMN